MTGRPITVNPNLPAHTCAATNCTRQVPTHLLMCNPHWQLVPDVLKRRVWAAYRTMKTVDGVKRYRIAVDLAVKAVAAKTEGAAQ